MHHCALTGIKLQALCQTRLTKHVPARTPHTSFFRFLSPVLARCLQTYWTCGLFPQISRWFCALISREHLQLTFISIFMRICPNFPLPFDPRDFVSKLQFHFPDQNRLFLGPGWLNELRRLCGWFISRGWDRQGGRRRQPNSNTYRPTMIAIHGTHFNYDSP